MKKVYLLCLLTFVSLRSNTQTFTLTQSGNEPAAGEFEMVWKMDTSAYTGGMPTALSGSAVVWNYANLGAIKHATVSYAAPSAVPASTAFSSCNLVQQDDTVLTFIKTVSTPSPQTEIVGLDIGLGSVNLSNTAIAYKYPFVFGDGFSDNVSGTFDSPFANGTCSGKITTTASATGTLLLPAGKTLSNVLGVKTSLTLTLTAFFTNIGTVKRTVYTYYHASEKYPILSFSYMEVRQLGASSATVSAGIHGNAFVLVGLPEIDRLNESLLQIFPNPSVGEVTLSLPEGVTGLNTLIQDATGRTVSNMPFTSKITTTDLAEGLYFVRVNTSKGALQKRLIVLH